MSQRGIDFLRNWMRDNISAATYPPLYDTRGKVYAEQCAADAQKQGVSVGEIEVEMGDLTDCMLKAMDEVSDRETNRVSPNTTTMRHWDRTAEFSDLCAPKTSSPLIS